MNNYINHVCFVIDASGSMSHLRNDVVRVFDNQIKMLADLSKQLDQETRVTVYLFDDVVKNVIFDKDVLRLPSLKDLYKIGGSTALVDASILGISDLMLTMKKYGDHSFLMYAITDGMENASKQSGTVLNNLISNLDDSWTVAAFVPDINGKLFASKFGFPNDNIQIWSTTAAGIEEVNKKMTVATERYMQARSMGIRSTRNLFNLDTSQLNTRAVKKQLVELRRNEYSIFGVNYDTPIRDFVESQGLSYVLGNSYYQLTKPEKIQTNKQICVRSKSDGKVYTGQNARDLLGLPDYEVKVSPVHASYDIFVQSTSVNRKLINGTNLLVMR